MKASIGLATTYVTWSLYGVACSAAKFGPGVVLIQAALSFSVFFGYCRYKKIKLSWKESRISFSYSLVRVAALGLSLYTYLILDVGIFTTIGACSVFVLTGIFAPLSGEKFKKSIIAPTLVSIFGVALVSGVINENGVSQISFKYMLAILAMFVSSLSIVLWRRCVLKISGTNHIVYMHGWTTVLSIPMMLVLITTHTISSDMVPSWIQLTLIVLASISGALGDIIYSFTQKISSLTLNGLFVPSSAVFTCIFGWILLGEKLNVLQMSGVVLIVLSVGIASYFSTRSVVPKSDLGNEEVYPRGIAA